MISEKRSVTCFLILATFSASHRYIFTLASHCWQSRLGCTKVNTAKTAVDHGLLI